MQLGRRQLLATGAAAGAVTALPRLSRAQAANTIRIGVMNDMSGTYKDNTGPGSVACTQQAIAEFGSKGFNVELIFADHQNKPDVGVNLARQWYDQGVDMILDVPTCSVGARGAKVSREKNKAALNVGSATSDLTGAQCTPNDLHWAYDTYMLAKSTGGATVKAGGDTWFFITADYAFGHALERDTSNFVKAAGGKVLGAVRTPFPARRISRPSCCRRRPRRQGDRLRQCRGRHHQLRQAGRGIRRHPARHEAGRAADVHHRRAFASGWRPAQGLVCSETFYWDLNDRTRAFTKRVLPQMPQPLSQHDPCRLLLRDAALPEGGGGDGRGGGQGAGTEVVNRMKAMPTDDDAFGPGTHPRRRAQDRPVLPVRGEEARGEQGPLGLLQAAADHPGRGGLPPAGRGRLPAGPQLSISRRGGRRPRRTAPQEKFV